MRAAQKNLTYGFYTILSLPATAMGFALSVQIACLSWILSTKYGLNLEEVGLVWLSGPLAGIIGQIVVGIISDKVWFWNGRRRPFILIGGTIAALMLLALPYIDVINEATGIDSLLGIALTIALTLDLAVNVSFNPTRSLIADVTPPGDKRTLGYTWMQTISGFFGVLAYLIGAQLGNYTLIYGGAAFVFLISFFPTFFIEEPRELVADTEEGEGQGSRSTNWTEFLKVCLAHSFTWLGVQVMFIFTYGYIKEVIMGFESEATLDEEQSFTLGQSIGYAFAILNTVGFLLPTLVLEPLARSIGRVRTHMLAIAVMAVGYGLTVFFATSHTMLYLMMIIIGVGWAAVVSLPFAIMSEFVDQNRMGFFMGLFNLSVVLPQIVAALLGDFISEQPDRSIIFVISGVSLAISAVLWLLVKENKSATVQ
ncbi:MAG: MFS transporter [Bacteroidota bacterium]